MFGLSTLAVEQYAFARDTSVTAPLRARLRDYVAELEEMRTSFSVVGVRASSAACVASRVCSPWWLQRQFLAAAAVRPSMRCAGCAPRTQTRVYAGPSSVVQARRRAPGAAEAGGIGNNVLPIVTRRRLMRPCGGLRAHPDDSGRSRARRIARG